MNEFSNVSASQIDRLVDGELHSTERRAVLVALDHEEGGWRRLALAFLESQVLREGLARKFPVVNELGRGELSKVAPLPQPRRTSGNWRTVATFAICGLLLFGLGRLSIPVSKPAPPVQPPIPATYSSADTPSGDQQPPIIVAETKSPDVQRQETLRLELGDSAENSQSVEVPVVEGVTLDPDELLKASPMISDSLQRDLLRSGRRVYEQRQLYEVTLDDGRSGVVPISEVFVENVGWNIYQ